MDKHFDVAVLGVWFGANYGSLLNGYATYKILKSFGCSVLMVNKPNAAANDWEIVNPHCSAFISKFYDRDDISALYPYARMHELNDLCDTFLIGSDQIWHYHLIKGFNNSFLLNFADDDKKKISFGTSFGHKNNTVPPEVMPEATRLFQRFHAISVREQSSADILKDVYKVKSTVTAEPVFCLERKEYEEIAACSDFEIKEPYLLSYILDPTQKIIETIEYYCNLTGMKSINILDGDPFHNKKMREIFTLPNTPEEPGAEDLVKLYQNAAFVITDSFHGTCFSIIFEKPFLAIANYKRGVARFSDLLTKYRLLDRLAMDVNNIPKDEKFLLPVDYTKIREQIAEERVRSIAWLKNAVETPKEEMPSIILEGGKELKEKLEKAQKEAEQKARLETEKLHNNEDFIKIRLLATLLRDYGVKHIVLSPGGRDVPIVRMFEYNEESYILHRVTDERSAAYFGMGIATQLRQPVACVCTSGTAASNYLPAVTEAYYTGIPLIMVTADRYAVYHEQGEDQTIPQSHIYDGVIKKSVTIPEGSGYKVEYQTRRDISDCILETTHNGFGPTHINIAIDNISVGSRAPKEAWKLLPKIYPHILRVGFNNGEKKLTEWVEAMKRSLKILVVYGQNPPPSEQQRNNIEAFARKYNCVIVTDFISNLDCAYSLKPYNMLQAISQQEFNEKLSPDILITAGGKRLMNDPLTFKVRHGLKNIRHWSVTPDGKIKDFYFRLTSVIEMSQDRFFEWFSKHAGDIMNNGQYYESWRYLSEKYNAPEIKTFNAHYVQSKFFPVIPPHSMLHLGVGQSFVDCRRYMIDKAVETYCNMGTNGIDGCTSTFMGQCSVVKDRLCFLIVGDLSFFYDMNSIWNKERSKNIRILMVNNNGSGLLRGHGLKAISSVHNTAARGWVESTGFEYITAENGEEYQKQLEYFISDKPQRAVFFEVFCE